jgi:tetratricopeptide (TPR) repeat protein/transcriptional regulator with XRE-family HTH domain
MARQRLGNLPLAELVAKQRERLSLSLEETAQRVQGAASLEDKYCAFTRQTIYEIERGRVPHPRNLRWLAIGLDLPTEQVTEAAQHQRMKRRAFLRGTAVGAGALLLPDSAPWERLSLTLETRLGVAAASTVEEDDSGRDVIAHLRTRLDQYHRADKLLGPHLLLMAMPGHLAFIEQYLREVRKQTRTELLAIGARYAEFAGWLHQDAGNAQAAIFWSDRAVEWAQQAGNRVLVSYVLTRKSNQASDDRDAGRIAGLAEAAQREPAPIPGRVRALALRQEAYAYALDGDELACNRKLDEALNMVALSEHNGDPGPGSYCTAVYLELHRATCWQELGQPKRAIDLFERELVKLPAAQNRDRGVYLARLAAAYADDDDPERAAAKGHEAVAIFRSTGSWRIGAELGRLRPRVERWRDLPVASQLHQDLGRMTYQPLWVPQN